MAAITVQEELAQVRDALAGRGCTITKDRSSAPVSAIAGPYVEAKKKGFGRARVSFDKGQFWLKTYVKSGWGCMWQTVCSHDTAEQMIADLAV